MATHVVFEPLDFMARLAALVPNPRINLTRYHGVFAPNHHWREQVTPTRRGRRQAAHAEKPPTNPHASGTLDLLSLGITPFARRSTGGSHAPQFTWENNQRCANSEAVTSVAPDNQPFCISYTRQRGAHD